MIIKTERPVAIFDVDGVIVQNPTEALGQNNAISDRNFWDRHWLNPDGGTLNREICDLAKALQNTGVHIIFMTARPESYRAPTLALLNRAGFPVFGTSITKESRLPILIMHEGHSIVPSGQWKQEQIREIQRRAHVMFMVEDFKPNAEAIRSVVPVLLYEYKRVSHYLGPQCMHGCGGLNGECFCHRDCACSKAPGYYCTRRLHHDGPCAAVPYDGTQVV